MAILIGPTFPAELAAAGLSGLPFSWSAFGTITFGDSMTADQIDAVMAVYTAHDPTATGVTVRQIEAAEVLAAGVLVHSGTNNDLTTRWRLDDKTASELGAIALGSLTGLRLPLDGFSFSYPAYDGHPVSMTATEFQTLYRALRDFIAAVQLYGAEVLQTLPTQPVEIF